MKSEDIEGLIADFIKSNIGPILSLAKKAYKSSEESLQITLRTAYSDYLTNASERYSKSKSFFIRNEWVDLYSYYVPTGISSNKVSITTPDFESCISHSKNLIISGSGGSGKSVLVKHLFLSCIRNRKYVPILIELRELNVKNINLSDLISNTLEHYRFNVSGQYIDKAKEAGHFCFFLDGYDEVSYSLRKKLIQDIRKLLKYGTGCPIFISSRPDDTLDGLEEFSRFDMLPLNLDTATLLIEKLPYESKIKNKFIKDLENGLFYKHQSFLSNPLLLSIMLLTYGENAEIPSKLSIFYNQAYEALFLRHDAKKDGVFIRERLTDLDIQDFSRIFSFLCLLTYEKRKFKFPRTECLIDIEKSRQYFQKEFKAEDYLSDLLSAACLLLEDGLDVAFSHRSFQEYFVALYISNASEDIQKKLITRYWKNMRSDNVIDLLLELNPDLIEKFLLLPKLEELFKKIRVTEHVGITHTFRYFSLSYSEIKVGAVSTRATLHGLDANYSDIVHIANRHLRTYLPQNIESRRKFHTELFEKYALEGLETTYTVSDLTYKNPLISDILKSDGRFSIKYLQCAYNAYKNLKAKYQKRITNLDKLLGIA